MRMLLTIRLPHETFNAAVRDGTVSAKMDAIIETAKPEALYFTEMDGQRTALLVTDLEDPSKIPALAEPWFLTFNANVEFRVVMRPEDLQRAGLETLGKQWG